MIRPEKFTAIFFLSVIMTFMMLLPMGLINRVNEKADMTQRALANRVIDWKKVYPFYDDTETNSRTVQSVTYQYIKGKIEDFTSSKHLVGSMTAVELAKKYEEAIGWNITSPYEYNGLMRLSGGYLTTLDRSCDVSVVAGSVIDFADYCRSNGIDFLYISVPSKICVSEDKAISGVLDFSNQNADKFHALLNASGVNTCDIRKLLHEEGMNHHEAFFKTDHHWKPETGLWASKHILQILRDTYGWDMKPDILNPENFRHVIYPEWFLGSQGKKFMLSRTKPEDFTMLYPKYETNIRVEIPDMSMDKTGDFSVIYDMSKVASKDYYNLSPYHAYSYGEHAVMRVINLLADNNKRVLLIRDSYSDVVIPFIAMGIRNLEAIDLRGMTGSVRRYIEANKPELVIVMYSVGVAGGSVWGTQRHCDFR